MFSDMAHRARFYFEPVSPYSWRAASAIGRIEPSGAGQYDR
jgi:hypothetical protein